MLNLGLAEFLEKVVKVLGIFFHTLLLLMLHFRIAEFLEKVVKVLGIVFTKLDFICLYDEKS